jgi:hypothetical protein
MVKHNLQAPMTAAGTREVAQVVKKGDKREQSQTDRPAFRLCIVVN